MGLSVPSDLSGTKWADVPSQWCTYSSRTASIGTVKGWLTPGAPTTTASHAARSVLQPGQLSDQLPIALLLQESAGNAAVQQLLLSASGPLVAQRSDDEQPLLQSSLLAGNPRVEAAVRKAPPLSSGEHSDGVQLLQHGMSQLGYALPRSLQKDDTFDGIFGPETNQIVRRFQVEHDVKPPGGWEAGRKTLSRLDQLLRGGPEPPKPEPSARFLVDDPSQAGPGQMQVGVFLSGLPGAVIAEVAALFEGTPYRVEDCPFIPRWFDFYAGQNAEHVEQAVQRFGAPAAAAAKSAGDYMQIALQRVAASVPKKKWLDSGRVVGVPDDVDPSAPDEDTTKNAANPAESTP
jgi:peptidoglycan hydrolase-like protein with peptidoglycan-binding domain